MRESAVRMKALSSTIEDADSAAGIVAFSAHVR